MFKRLIKAWIGAGREEQRFHGTFNRVVAEGGFLSGNSGVLLDVGARDGVFIEQLLLALERASSNPAAVRASWKAIVVDINFDYLAEARKRFPTVAADMEGGDWPFASGGASCVVMNQLLEHLKDPFRVLGEADRVLRAGGLLILGVPNLAGWVNRLYLLCGKQPPAIHFPGPHVRGFTWRAFKRFLETNPNFRIEKTFGSCWYPLPPFLSEAWAVRRPQAASYMFFVLRKTADAQPSAWLIPRGATGETTFG